MIAATLTPAQRAAFDATGQVWLPVPMTEHYAYCTDATCRGCLPSDDDVRSMHLLDLWAEMLKRCISQTPDTKTREGAIAAIVAQGEWYRSYTSDDPAFLGIRRPDPAWLALTEPCETCGGTGFVPGVDDVGVPMTHRQRCPVVGCVNGRKRIELQAPCGDGIKNPRVGWWPSSDYHDETCTCEGEGTVLVATASVAEVLPVVANSYRGQERPCVEVAGPRYLRQWIECVPDATHVRWMHHQIHAPHLGDPAALVGSWLALAVRDA